MIRNVLSTQKTKTNSFSSLNSKFNSHIRVVMHSVLPICDPMATYLRVPILSLGNAAIESWRNVYLSLSFFLSSCIGPCSESTGIKV